MTRGTKHGEESNFGGVTFIFLVLIHQKNYRLLSAYQELSKQYLKRSRWLHNTVTVVHTTEPYIQNGQTGKPHVPYILPQFEREDRGSWSDGLSLAG